MSCKKLTRCRPYRVKLKSWNLLFLFLIVYLGILVACSYWQSPSNSPSFQLSVVDLQPLNWTEVNPSCQTTCRFHTSFDINRCVFSLEDIMSVYIGNWCKFHDPQLSGTVTPEISLEYLELVEAVKKSRYYTEDPSVACVFIPPVDTLSQKNVEVNTMSVLLNSLPQWRDGANYLIFNMLPGGPPHFNATPEFYYGKAMLAGAGLAPTSYRSGFDISIPTFNPLTRSDHLYKIAADSDRPHLLTIITHGGLPNTVVQSVVDSKEKLLLLQTVCPDVPLSQLPRRRCGSKTGHTYPFPEVLLSSRFCWLVDGAQTGTLDFTDMMMTGCIPVVTNDMVLPFSEVLDWTLASIRCLSCDLDDVVLALNRIPTEMVVEWRHQVLYLYKRYFSSMATIAMMTLNILNERLFPISGRSYDWWNSGYEVSHVAKELDFLAPPKNEGFTAVILTYNRVPSLFKVITSVAKAPSCSRIMVIWNNVEVDPPPSTDWPRTKQPIEVIRSKENKLSNRFYPYNNLTSAVLSLDDDITMLTSDELEFAFKAWQEFPNRLVGFPSRVHMRANKDSGNNWKYVSKWMNNISLVLTGAAFYHKYYNYLYTYEMSKHIRDWVDSHMNCEDIAMNFLVSNYTGLPPLKVGSRKKFACPKCLEDALVSDPEHYKERDDCINIFEHFFGAMPLKSVKFRLDPILYKMDVEREVMWYPDVGEL